MSQNSGDTPAGLGFAFGAYFLWGFLPLYMKLLSHVGPAEVVAHRIIWSVPLAGILLILLRRTGDLRAALTSPRTLAMGCVTAALITVNWGIYVWAITSDRALDAALGYYINPLFSVALGAILLREKLSGAQMVAIALAACAVAVLTISAGTVPWAAIGLTVTWLGLTGQGTFLVGDAGTDWLLLGCGAATASPLILYANGAKGLRLTTIAALQYIAPTMIFLCAVVVFKEPFGQARMIAFPMIWAALVIYSVTMLREMRRA